MTIAPGQAPIPPPLFMHSFFLLVDHRGISQLLYCSCAKQDTIHVLSTIQNNNRLPFRAGVGLRW